MRKGLERDRLMFRMWKTIKVMFSRIAPQREFFRLDLKDFMKFPHLSRYYTGGPGLEDLDFDDDSPPLYSYRFSQLLILGFPIWGM